MTLDYKTHSRQKLMSKTNFLKYKGMVEFPLIQHLGGQRQASLVYITGSRPARVTQ